MGSADLRGILTGNSGINIRGNTLRNIRGAVLYDLDSACVVDHKPGVFSIPALIHHHSIAADQVPVDHIVVQDLPDSCRTDPLHADRIIRADIVSAAVIASDHLHRMAVLQGIDLKYRAFPVQLLTGRADQKFPAAVSVQVPAGKSQVPGFLQFGYHAVHTCELIFLSAPFLADRICIEISDLPIVLHIIRGGVDSIQSQRLLSLLLFPDFFPPVFVGNYKIDVCLLIPVEHLRAEIIGLDPARVPGLAVKVVPDRSGHKLAAPPGIELIAGKHQLRVIHPADIRLCNIIGIAVGKQITAVHRLGIPLSD